MIVFSQKLGFQVGVIWAHFKQTQEETIRSYVRKTLVAKTTVNVDVEASSCLIYRLEEGKKASESEVLAKGLCTTDFETPYDREVSRKASLGCALQELFPSEEPDHKLDRLQFWNAYVAMKPTRKWKTSMVKVRAKQVIASPQETSTTM